MGDIDPNNDPTRVVDDTPFPDPSLYFKVFDSERDEPDAKYREDVIKLYERWEQKYGRKWPENGLNTEDLVWLYNEAYQDERRLEAAHAKAAGGGGPKTYPREKQDYEGQVRRSSNSARGGCSPGGCWVVQLLVGLRQGGVGGGGGVQGAQQASLVPSVT